MAGTPEETSQLQVWVEQMLAGDRQAADRLISHALGRLQRLTRKMLRSYPAVRRWEQTDDVLHNAVMRLQRSLRQMRLTSAGQFLGLAAGHIRRELIDLARHYGGPEGLGRRHASGQHRSADEPNPPYEKADETRNPVR